jgi:CRISPR-associated protein Cmr1
VRIEAVTPIFRGGPAPDAIDTDRPFRASAVRGLLRFWWRATRSHTDPDALRETESTLFGSVFDERAIASKVRVGVAGPPSTAARAPDGGEYALWVVRDRSQKLFHDRASATLTVSCPAERAPEVRAALTAWLLLGGIGSRTRRGLGAVDAVHDELRPALSTMDELVAAIAALAPPEAPRRWASLGGASIAWGAAVGDPMQAWKVAVDTMKGLRMSTNHGQTRPAGFPVPFNWHDDDYVDFVAGRRFRSRRAALGLPLQFQSWGGGPRRFMGPQTGGDRAPSPIHLRPVRVGDRWYPMMAVLRVPHPDRVQIGGRGVAPVQGTVDPSGVDLFLADLDRVPGWTRRALVRP